MTFFLIWASISVNCLFPSKLRVLSPGTFWILCYEILSLLNYKENVYTFVWPVQIQLASYNVPSLGCSHSVSSVFKSFVVLFQICSTCVHIVTSLGAGRWSIHSAPGIIQCAGYNQIHTVHNKVHRAIILNYFHLISPVFSSCLLGAPFQFSIRMLGL